MRRGGGQLSGVVSLVMIFCSLCLCVFAVLTFSAADRERTMTEVAARQAAEYYNADSEATARVAQIKQQGLAEGDTAVVNVPVGTEQTLVAEVRQSGGELQILRWQTVFTGDWEKDETLEIWDGN